MRPGLEVPRPERITLTCHTCGRHASYIQRGPEPPRDETMDPHPPAAPLALRSRMTGKEYAR